MSLELCFVHAGWQDAPAKLEARRYFGLHPTQTRGPLCTNCANDDEDVVDTIINVLRSCHNCAFTETALFKHLFHVFCEDGVVMAWADAKLRDKQPYSTNPVTCSGLSPQMDVIQIARLESVSEHVWDDGTRAGAC